MSVGPAPGETGQGWVATARRAEAVLTAKAEIDYQRAGNVFPGAAIRRFGAVIATRLPALPALAPFNKARGFAAAAGPALGAISAFFTDVGVAPGLEVWAEDESSDLHGLLRDAGLAPADQAVTLHARLGGVAAEAVPEIRVQEVRGDDARYLDILFAGYGVGPGAENFRRMLALEHQTPGLRRYLAEVNGTSAAAAALFSSAGTSLLAGVATLPRFRHRGCQTALIARRLGDASADSDLAVATTAIASTSRDNLQRLGFQVAHVRTSWR